ncbi:Ger(x)C family spore germination protein [Ferroacidibacillus organovorans]|uniref:Ger(x)C family spore germination protein n=1 Tax=Ferroacidibacillus organovorans TaxID=1765683 RepID=UPI0015C46D19|nr:Ger(x)C family spore germination protein [Ferroacidibacillus organovorans]
MAKRIHRIGYASVVVLSLFCTGCWDAAEINELGIVVASGAELENPADPQSAVKAYVQVARPSQLAGGMSGGPSPSGNQKAFMLEEGTGPSAASALTTIQRRMSRRFFLRDRRVIVVGEAYAKRGLSDLLDEMIRNPDARLRSYILVAHNTSLSKLLSLSYPLTRLPADAMVELEESHQAVTINVVQFLKVLTGKSDPYAMGIRMLNTSSGNQGKIFGLDDVAVFKKDKMVGWLRGEASRGFFWVQPQSMHMRMNSMSIPIPGGGWLTSQLVVLNNVILPSWGKSGPRFTINLEVTDDILENMSRLKLDQPRDSKIAERTIEREILKEIVLLLTELKKTYHADIVGLGDLLFARYPKQWRTIEARWDQVYSRMPIQINVKVHIVRSGLIGDSVLNKSTSQGR